MEDAINKKVEVEYKFILSKSEVEAVKGIISKKATLLEEYLQINHYFDTDDLFLKKKKITLRLREKKGKWELTFKVPTKEKKKGPYHKKLEYDVNIDETRAKAILKQGIIDNHSHPMLIELFKEINLPKDASFDYLGEVKTYRVDYDYDGDMVSIDKSEYNGIVDYELEWETTKGEIPQGISELNLPLKKGKGKKTRYFESLGLVK